MNVRANTAYTLEPLSADEVAQWEELTESYPSRTLFHRRAWLDYLEASQGVAIRHWRIVASGRTVGYFCGGVLRKGPFRILGSPLRGWGTNVMGPVANPPVESAGFLVALERLASAERLAMIEIENSSLSSNELLRSRYEPETTWTYVVRLMPAAKEAIWDRLDPTRRTGIRKAERYGLVVEETQDESIADEFYDQYLDVMRRKGLVPPYGRERAHLLIRHLSKSGFLIALRVRDEQGRVAATGLFPHDETTLYFWGGASWPNGYRTCANDYMHWSAMCLAAQRGLSWYNMCGNGLFKKKFGGELVELRRWNKCYSSAARWGRKAYVVVVGGRQKLRGAWSRAFGGPTIRVWRICRP